MILKHQLMIAQKCSQLKTLLESFDYDKETNQYYSKAFKENLKTIPDAIVMAVESPNELDDKQRAEQQHVD